MGERGRDGRDEGRAPAGAPGGGRRAARCYAMLSRHRQALLVLADGAVWGVCIAVATLLRFEFDPAKSLTAGLLVIVVVAALMQAALGLVTPLYRTRWRVGSFEQVLCLATTIAVVTAGVTAVNAMPNQHVLPASATIGGGALALVAATAIRVLWRLRWERHRQPGRSAERTIVFVAGEAGAQLVDALLVDPTAAYRPVAVLDDDPAKRNLRLRSLKVSGTRRDLAAVAERHRADSVIIAIPSAGSRVVREITELADAAGLAAKVLPTVSQMLSPSVTTGDIRPVTPADLLGRRAISTRVDLIAGYLTGRRVLVTGAGGSIGSELCRQIHRYGPASLVMLDRDESAIHQVQLSIEGRALLDDRALALCDIRDAEALADVFDEHRPEVVFHAAALKHLPLLEMWPAEAVKSNVRGTENVLAAARAFGVTRFVNISTDKAVNPTSVLGYSKRIGECLTAGASRHAEGAYLSVRFGNVLGSRGSVLTTFGAQIAAGGPLTVTDPEVSRYFMTVEEAVELVIQAGAVGRGGEVLVLDMGEPVRIAEVAARMVAAAGRPIEVVYTGLRPVEKLREELFGDGEVDERPVHPLISHVAVEPLPTDALSVLDFATSAAEIREVLVGLCGAQVPGMAEVIDLTDPAVAFGEQVDTAVGL
ncbi:MAG: polysaccharide biosynthesis protein [Acidimicrobiales bacterium]